MNSFFSSFMKKLSNFVTNTFILFGPTTPTFLSAQKRNKKEYSVK